MVFALVQARNPKPPRHPPQDFEAMEQGGIKPIQIRLLRAAIFKPAAAKAAGERAAAERAAPKSGCCTLS